MGILDEFDNDTKDDWEDRPKKITKGKTAIYFVGVLLLLGLAIGGSLYVVQKRPEILGLSKNSTAIDEKELERIVAEVGELMLLPDETPTIATVTDLSKVTDQPFFKNALEGDKVLVYRAAKKAILYRPSENKIIEVGVVNLQEEVQNNNPDQNIEVELLPTITPTISPKPAATIFVSPTPTVGQIRLTPTVSVPPPQQ